MTLSNSLVLYILIFYYTFKRKFNRLLFGNVGFTSDENVTVYSKQVNHLIVGVVGTYYYQSTEMTLVSQIT